MSSIYNIRPVTNNNKFYSIIGSEDFIDDDGFPRVDSGEDARVTAKAIQSKYENLDKSAINFNNFKYYVKISPQKTLYNPKTNNVDQNQNQYKFINQKCKSSWFFQEVSQYIFDKYIMFLKTQDIRWLKMAEREIR